MSTNKTSLFEEIIDLSNLYKKMKKEFRNIKVDNVDLEIEQLNVTLQSIKEYFDELLKVIPKDITLYIHNRLQIKLEKTFYYDTDDSKNNTMSIVLLEDKCAYQEHSVLDRNLENLCFEYGNEKTTLIQTSTLEFLITNWTEIKQLVNKGITDELYSMMNKQFDVLINKIQFLETLANWRV